MGLQPTFVCSHITRQAQYEHPCATQYGSPGLAHHRELPLPQPDFHQHNVIVPANPYLTEEIPRFLRVYSRAKCELDHQLKVRTVSQHKQIDNENFPPSGNCSDCPNSNVSRAMLNRLYRQELEDLVLGYEAYRAGLQREIDERERRNKNNIEADLITNV